MMKWLGGIITALVLLALTSLIGTAIKGPIDDIASRERLIAQVQLTPWMEKPKKKDEKATEKAADTPESSIDEVFRRIQRRALSAVSDYQAARIIITNESNKTVTDINFRLSQPYVADEAVIIAEDGSETFLQDAARVKIPDLKPGDRATVFMWGGFSSTTFSQTFETFSSTGRFRVTLDWPQTQERYYASAISNFIDKYAGDMGTYGAFAAFLLFGAMAWVLDSYYKSLLKDENFYRSERDKYLKDPEKFSPTTTGSKPTDAAAPEAP
jgi:hypothetical protein